MTDQEVVALIPHILGLADRFHERAEQHVGFKDLLAQADALLAGVASFASAELLAVAPTVVAGAVEFAHSKNLGFVALGRLMQLQFLLDHPEIIQTAVQRAERALVQALHHGKLPD